MWITSTRDSLKNSKMKKILLVLTFILTLSSQLMAYEETNYEVVKENKIYEIRKYPNRLVIETNSVQGNGFRKLFNYIQEIIKKMKK